MEPGAALGDQSPSSTQGMGTGQGLETLLGLSQAVSFWDWAVPVLRMGIWERGESQLSAELRPYEIGVNIRRCNALQLMM